jgi:hypothetical protein
MDIQQFVVEASRFLFGAFATFCAILLWSRTRDMAWTLVIVGAITSYAAIVYETLVRFGVVEAGALTVGGMPLASVLLTDLPPLFLGLGFMVAAVRRRVP